MLVGFFRRWRVARFLRDKRKGLLQLMQVPYYQSRSRQIRVFQRKKAEYSLSKSKSSY